MHQADLRTNSSAAVHPPNQVGIGAVLVSGVAAHLELAYGDLVVLEALSQGRTQIEGQHLHNIHRCHQNLRGAVVESHRSLQRGFQSKGAQPERYIVLVISAGRNPRETHCSIERVGEHIWFCQQ